MEKKYSNTAQQLFAQWFGGRILPGGYRSPKRTAFYGFDPKINRWTEKPHLHQRESARRMHQQSA
jgi:hypothetical protein